MALTEYYGPSAALRTAELANLALPKAAFMAWGRLPLPTLEDATVANRPALTPMAPRSADRAARLTVRAIAKPKANAAAFVDG